MAPSKQPTTAQMRKALAQFQKGTKAKEIVYHGTGNLEGLTSFDPNMTGNGTDQLGSGFYFTTHPDEASGYASTFNAPGKEKTGGNDSPGVVAAHLAIKRPIKIGPNGSSLNDARINLSHDQVKQIMAHAPNILDPDESPLNNHVDTSRGVTQKMIHDIARLYTGNNLHALENDIFPGHPTEYRHALHKVTGHDGVIKDFGDGRKHYVAWFPEQVKSAIGNRGTYDPTNPDITKAQGGSVKNPFDYENPSHVSNVAGIASKHKDFRGTPDASRHLGEMLGTGNWKHLEDPRIQGAIKQAGHDAYYVSEKTGKQQHVIHKAIGGNVQPTMAQMKLALAQKGSPADLKSVGINEAPNLPTKQFFPPDGGGNGLPAPGGVATPSGMPIGGIDMSRGQPGQQLMAAPPQAGQPPAPGQPPQGGPQGGLTPQGPTPPMGNMLQMTPQGQAMSAMGGQQQPQQPPAAMASGGNVKYPYSSAHDQARINAIKMLGLHEKNTADERARAMGFLTAPSKETYHGTQGELEGAIDPSRSDLGFHNGTQEQAENRLRSRASHTESFPEGSNIIPLMISRYANLLPLKDEGTFHADSVAPQLAKKKMMDKKKAKNITKEIDADWKKRKQYDEQMRQILKQHGFHGGKYTNKQEGGGKSMVITDPSILRSRFAAFDPARKNENDLLAAKGGKVKPAKSMDTMRLELTNRKKAK